VQKISGQIINDPFAWSIEGIQLPGFVEHNPELRSKFLVRMAAVAEDARRQRKSEGYQGDI
jgi:hypothetical protein